MLLEVKILSMLVLADKWETGRGGGFSSPSSLVISLDCVDNVCLFIFFWTADRYIAVNVNKLLSVGYRGLVIWQISSEGSTSGSKSEE